MSQLITIAHMRSPFPEKFGIPRQSGLVESTRSQIIFEPEYRNPDALRGLESFSHLWLIWGFSAARQDSWSPTVRPPRLGGNTRMGVFATRSPFRPNSMGLSSVKIESIEQSPALGPVIHVLGGDLMDASPIYDIKPYIPYADSHPDALGGFADTPPTAALRIEIDPKWKSCMSREDMTSLMDILAQDPRPSYHNDPDRIYAMTFAGVEVKFSVRDSILTVLEIGQQPS